MLQSFDHVNVRTARLDEMVAWYADVLGLHAGARPPFPFPGAWLYLGDLAVIHLVGEEREPEAHDPKIEHYAFRATDLPGFKTRVEDMGVKIDWVEVPGVGVLQANIFDPDGNHIHIDFDKVEGEGLGLI